ncbi:MAG: insulinase family protein [Acidobacteria bacterium]|nr:insulinase family protein [Acidobacteriota bacterium]
MTSARRALLLLITAAFVVSSWLVGTAQAPPPAANPAAAALTDTMPVDTRITTGRFPNGLRYYVRANKKPEGRAELRLAVNAGSVLEDDDQRGLAHFVEHMAFNGTTNFPKQDIVNFVQSIGMRFGNDLNASTGFDETVYMLQVPTDRAPVLDRAMLILRDWATNVTFDPAEIDKERGVVLEEWRLGLGAQGRLRDKQFPVLLQGSRYATRLPIGTPETLRTFPHDRLRQFYNDWYRPDLMAVVAVGDFDVAQIQALIKKHFEPIPAAVNPRPRPVYTLPDHPGTRYAIATDPELGGTSVSVYHTVPARDQSTIAAYRQQLVVERLFTGMLNARLSELAVKPGAPFLGAGADIGAFVRTVSTTTLAASVRETGVEPGLDALFTEAARVARFGFTPSEFERQKTTMLRNLERAMAEFDNQQSASLAAEYIRNFTTDEPIPGLAYEYELYKRFLPEISLDEMNALARTWAPDNNRIVVVSAPAKAAAALPTEARLAAVMASASKKTLTAYEDTVSAQPLVANAPRPGTIASTTRKPEFGITEWKLSNGATVVLKPTTFRQDEVLMRAFSPGGTSLVPDQDYIPAETAAHVVAAGGVGAFNAVDLRKALTGKAAAAGPSIGEYFEELNGTASPKDLETLFQLVYLRFTQPRADPAMFSVITDQTRVALANQRNSPEFAFNEALTNALWQGHPRSKILSAEDLDRMDLQKSLAFYKERFADAGGFTFVFVGSFDPAAIEPLAERYLASLPSSGRQEQWRDVGLRRATGVIERTVRKGTEPKAQTSIVFTGPFQYDQAHRVTLRAMAMVLEGALRNSLREDLGGTYGVGVSSSAAKVPVPGYTLSISFGSDPARTDALIRTVFDDIDALKTNGPDERDVRNIREILTREYESSSRQNGFLLREITARYQNGEDLADLFALPKFYEQINGPEIQEAARRYFNANNVITVKLVPEK